jgi:hypothetical protein
MAYLFLAALLLGLVLGVFMMLLGVERRPRRSSTRVSPLVSRETLIAASNEISARFHLPIVAAFTTMFGATGYLLTRYSPLGTAGRIIIATGAGALLAAGAVVLIARWAIPSARRDVPDERYLWQGMLAHVTAAIDATTPGRITVEVDGTRHAVSAVSVTGEAIDSGSDVVIERIEEGIAFVEPWTVVERRL